ncbi:MAG: hypothetical protein ACKVZJ_03515 [Phycisphaerales bacterium]
MDETARINPNEIDAGVGANAAAAGLAKPALVSFSVSLAAHALIAVMALAVVWTVTMPAREDRPDITVSFFDPTPSGVVLTSEPEDVPLAALAPVTPTAPPLSPPDQPRPETRVNAPTLSEKIAANSETTAPEAPGGVGVSTSNDERRALIESSAFPEVKFAGLGAGNAKSLIYVVDAGGSMVTTFAQVKDDLKGSLFKTAPSQTVQVIFFKDGRWFGAPHPQDPRAPIEGARMIRATRENIRAVSAWIDTVRPSGVGNPVVGLEAALAFRPDAVFVLSSVIPGVGEWKPEKQAIMRRLEELNPRAPDGRRPAVIKTIQYLDADPQGILQAIAEAHGGKDGYNFIKRTR